MASKMKDLRSECQNLVERMILLTATEKHSTEFRPGFINEKVAFSRSDMNKIKRKKALASARRVLASILRKDGCPVSYIAKCLGVAPSTGRTYATIPSHRPTMADFETVRRLIDGEE